MTIRAEATPRTVHEAVTRGEALLVDVREPWEFDEQHIEGAVLIPLADLPERLSELPTDRDIYVHCRMGGRSARAVEYLQAQGFPRARNVIGGLEAWAETGLPVV